MLREVVHEFTHVDSERISTTVAHERPGVAAESRVLESDSDRKVRRAPVLERVVESTTWLESAPPRSYIVTGLSGAT
jgi:hypothetical protein